ncbi:uncharacterized protein [Odocoileus virginianus]|uniref:Small lysine-rich protein 1 n=1 Tax=Odocoileus virginianus TaxID=9874 RepID=A0A6J0YJS0_ODOVR
MRSDPFSHFMKAMNAYLGIVEKSSDTPKDKERRLRHLLQTRIPETSVRRVPSPAWRRGGVAAWRRGGVAAWRRGGVAAWRRGGVADGPLAPPGSPEPLGLLAPRRGSRSQTNAARSRDRGRFAGECGGGTRPAKGKKKSQGKSRGKKTKKPEVDILSPAAMLNLYYIAHNVADCLQLRGFRWPGAAKAKKGKGKT